MIRCFICNQSYSRRDALQRHEHNVHGSGKYTDQSQPLKEMTFRHPFSMMVTGPSGSGKTEWTRKLLLSSLVQPPPERFLWCLYKSHLGGNIYCTITEGSACMDIRQYWKPQEEVIPTKKGLYLRPLEYIAVKELLTEIGRVLPELDGVVPCYMQSDHMNQLGALRCSECNPNDYQNW